MIRPDWIEKIRDGVETTNETLLGSYPPFLWLQYQKVSIAITSNPKNRNAFPANVEIMDPDKGQKEAAAVLVHRPTLNQYQHELGRAGLARSEVTTLYLHGGVTKFALVRYLSMLPHAHRKAVDKRLADVSWLGGRLDAMAADNPTKSPVGQALIGLNSLIKLSSESERRKINGSRLVSGLVMQSLSTANPEQPLHIPVGCSPEGHAIDDLVFNGPVLPQGDVNRQLVSMILPMTPDEIMYTLQVPGLPTGR